MFGFTLMLRRLAVALHDSWKDPAFRALLILLLLVVSGATVFYRLAEKWSWLDAFYFSVITGLTIGYGDFAPTTPFSKIFTMVYALVAVGLFVALGTSIARALVTHDLAERDHLRHRHDHAGPHESAADEQGEKGGEGDNATKGESA